MSDLVPEPEPERGGVSAGWVVGLVITLTLGLGAAFLIVAMSHPVELVDTADTSIRDAGDGQAPEVTPTP